MQVTTDKVVYVAFENLADPEMVHISDNIIQCGFDSKEWTVQFQTITKLRQANKHYSMIFVNELLRKFYKNIIEQVENLRSNNSKQALTLISEFFQAQDLSNIQSEIIRPIVAILFTKSVSEKGFIKAQALKAINRIPNSFNPNILEELMHLTKSNNGTISQLSIRIINQMLQKNAITDVSQKFLKQLSLNINGKRMIVQRQARQILGGLKKRIGQNKLEQIIDGSSQLDPEDSVVLKRQMKNENSKSSSASFGFKQFMKHKKGYLSSIA